MFCCNLVPRAFSFFTNAATEPAEQAILYIVLGQWSTANAKCEIYHSHVHVKLLLSNLTVAVLEKP